MGRGQELDTFERNLATSAGTTLADPLVARLVTPEAVVSLLSGRLPPEASAGRSSRLSVRPLEVGSVGSAVRIFMASQSRGFRNILIALPDGRPRTEQVRLHLRLSGTAWRPPRVELPQAMVTALVKQLPPRVGLNASRRPRAVRVALAAAGGLAWRGEVPHSLEALLAVLAAAFLHASWNAIAKGRAGRHPLAGPFLIAVGATADGGSAPRRDRPARARELGLPGRVGRGPCGLFRDDRARLSAGRLFRGVPAHPRRAPLMTSVLAALWLGEVLSGQAVGGVVLLSAGIVGLSSDALKQGHLDRRSLGTAALTAGVVVAYTLLDGLGARLSAMPPPISSR